MQITRVFKISRDKTVTEAASIPDALQAIGPDDYVWVDCENPTHDELTLVTRPFEIHALSVEDCLDDNQVPKIENFPTNTHILFNDYQHADKSMKMEEISFFVGNNFFLSVHGRADTQRHLFEKFHSSVMRHTHNICKGPDLLLHLCLDLIVDEKFGVIDRLHDQIDLAEDKILKNAHDFKPSELVYCRRSLSVMRKSLFHEREIVTRICRGDSPFIKEHSLFQFRDIYDHLTKYFEVIELTREMIASILDIYLSMINNHMARVSNRTNRVVQRLTFITTVFMPLTLLSGIGGMSEWTMMTGPENWKIAYPLAIAGMVIIGLITFTLLRWWDAVTRNHHTIPDRAAS